jgi:hypothetical protein
MSNPKFLAFLKIFFTIVLCVLFGFVYGKFIGLFTGMISLTSRWVYFVLAIPIFLPIFEYVRTEYKKRPKFSHLIKELFFTFISAIISVWVLVNFEFGGEYTDYYMSAIGLVMVIILANLLNLGLNKGFERLRKNRSQKR